MQRRETLISEQLLLGVMSLDEEKEFIASRIPTLNSPPLLHHDMRFSRILGHLYFRAQRLRYPPAPFILGRCWGGWLAPVMLFDAVEAEARKQSEDPIREVIKNPPPRKLEEVWETFVVKSLETNPLLTFGVLLCRTTLLTESSHPSKNPRKPPGRITKP